MKLLVSLLFSFSIYAQNCTVYTEYSFCKDTNDCLSRYLVSKHSYGKVSIPDVSREQRYNPATHVFELSNDTELVQQTNLFLKKHRPTITISEHNSFISSRIVKNIYPRRINNNRQDGIATSFWGTTEDSFELELYISSVCF